MRPKDRGLAKELADRLMEFDRSVFPILGIRRPDHLNTLVGQIVESIHRIDFVKALLTSDISPARADPDSTFFDPLKAAVLMKRVGDLDESSWLVFLFVHFGKHSKYGYSYARHVYGGLGETRWSWVASRDNPRAFREWLHSNGARLRPLGGFGNHRKYESLSARSTTGTGAAVESYTEWVTASGSHSVLFGAALNAAGGDSRRAFGHLYRSMGHVVRFGRTARFDYLAMIGKLGISPIEPDSAYLSSSTGPVRGAELLFGKRRGPSFPTRQAEKLLVDLAAHLGVGLQVIEDALCNWQKSPGRFTAFRG